MMFRAEKATLSAAAKWVSQALPARPTQPILAGMLLEVGDDGVTLSAYDGQLGASILISVEVSTPGRVLMPGKLFGDVLSHLSSGMVEVELDAKNRAVVRAGGAEFHLVLMPVEDYPKLPALPVSCGSLDGEDFRSAVEAVAYATGDFKDVNDLRIDGVRIETRGDEITFVATDRYRIPVAVRQWARCGGGDDVSVAVSPAALLGFAKAATGRVELAFPPGGSAGLLGLSCGARTLVTGLFAGEYPKWKRAVPSEDSLLTAVVNVGEFQGALKRAQLVLEDKKPVWVTFLEGCVQLESGEGPARLGGTSTMSEVIGAEVRGEEMTCYFNPKYLIDALSAAPTPEVVLHMNGTGSALMTSTEGGPDYRHVLMPQRNV